MNVDTITISQDLARQKLRDYAALTGKLTIEDDLLREAYRAAASGLRLINVAAAIRTVGLNVQGEPRLAMARADWSQCAFHPNYEIRYDYAPGGGIFTEHRRISPQLKTNCFTVPTDTFNRQALTRTTLFSPLPHIPPNLRPRPSAYRRFWILFEVEKWQEYPADPFLLRHVAGPFYAVEAEWELTPLEVSLLSALAS